MARTLAVVALVAMLGVAAAVPTPTFPDNWTSDQMQSIQINQGGVAQPDGSICCPPESPQCKVQTMFQAGIQYFSTAANKTAFKGPDGAGIVTDFNLQKEFSVTASGACQAYCPLGGQTIQGAGIAVAPNSTYMGTVNYNGQMVEDWRNVQKIPILNITMEIDDFYVNTAGASPMPVALISQMTPLGQKIGQQNTTFVSFTAGVPDAKHFLVTGIASCPMSKNCQGGGGGDDDGGEDSMTAVRRLSANGDVMTPVLRRRLGTGPLEVVYSEL